MINPSEPGGGQEASKHSIPRVENAQRYWWHFNKLASIMGRLGTRVSGGEAVGQLYGELPEGAGVVLAPTHSSWLDIPALTQLDLPEVIRFLGKKELSRIPYIKGLAKDSGVVWVDRGDSESKRDSVEIMAGLVEAGETIVMYPEGTRNRSKDPYSIAPKLKTGVARVAINTVNTVAIVPIGIGYDQLPIKKWPNPRGIGVVVGEPSIFEGTHHKEGHVEEVTQDLHAQLASLKVRAAALARE